MFSYRYDIYNFRQIVQKFLEYCSFWEETEDIAIVNYRYDTWQGATLAIPIDDYRVDKSVTEDIHIVSTGVETIKCFTSKQDPVYYASKYSLQNILKRIYPNANIDVFIYSYSSVDIMQNILDKINSYNNGGKLIFCFSDYNPLYSSETYIDVKLFLDTINDAGKAKELDTYIVYTPNINYTDNLNNIIESYIYEDSARQVFNFYTELEMIRDDLQDALTNLNYYDSSDYRNIYTYAQETGIEYLALDPYSRNIIHLFSRFILSNIFNIDREEYYVSLMYRDNPKSLYSQLFTTYDEYMIEEFNYDQYIHGGWSIRSKYGTNPPNIFKNTGQIVSVGVHTSYDPYLWVCEQGGITCKKEEDEQINDLDLMDFWAFFNGTPNKRVKPPVFPTTGCPWFTISNKNIADYGIANCPAKLYITRSGSSFILTIRVIDANGQRPDLWQSITFGEFVGRQDGYNIDQFYCAGGNQALSPDSWTYFATSHIIGLQMDLDMKNSSIVNSNILHPSKFEKTNLSNFRIMNGEGTWEDIYSATQGYREYQYLDGAGNATIYTWGVPLTKPNFNLGNNLNTAYPYLDWQHKIDSYTINSYDLKKNNMSGKIDPLTVYLAK